MGLNFPILIHMPYFHGGGAEAALVRLANYWHGAGRQVGFVVNSDLGAVRNRLAAGIRVDSLGNLRTGRALPRLISYLKQAKPPLIVSALISANIAAGVAVRFGSPATAHVALARNYLSNEIQEEGFPKQQIFRALLRWTLRRANAVGCVSSAVRQDVIGFAGVAPGRTFVTLNPTPEFADQAAWPRPAEYPADGQPVVLCVGRLSEQKDYPTALAAFARLRARRPATLVILGDGPLRGEIEGCIAALGLQESVRLLGYRADPERYMAAANILALTSRYEGFPNVVAEAVRLGVTVVATDAPGGAREALDGGRLGYMTQIGDIEGIAKALEQAIDQPIDRMQLVQHAHNFDIETVAGIYDAMFFAAITQKEERIDA